ncbi:MAG: integrase [Clostridiales bacterium]|nr:integrase [Clostridiales bacterium]
MTDESTGLPVDREELIEQRAKELEEGFSYDGYQIVRKELFAHLRDPAVVIRRDSVTFNTACINGLEDVVYVHIMINAAEKKMVVRACSETDKDALRWCVAKQDKRKSRKMVCREFAAKLYRDMEWEEDCRYKILGYRITVEGQTIYIFDLMETEVFLDTKKPKKEVATENQQSQSGDDHVKVTRRKGYLSDELTTSYGLPVEAHENAMSINIREGYVQLSDLPDNKRLGDDVHGAGSQ